MHILVGYIAVFVGAGLGGFLRHALNRGAMHLGWALPWATFVINVTGSLVMGLVAGWFAFRGEAGQTMRLFLTTGILGGYTTFSTFSLDTALLWERGEIGACALYVASSVGLSLVSVFAGLAIMRQLST